MQNSEISKMSFQISIQKETSDRISDKPSYFPNLKIQKDQASKLKDKIKNQK